MEEKRMNEGEFAPKVTVTVKHYKMMQKRIKDCTKERNFLRAVVITLAIIIGVQAGYINHLADTVETAQAVEQMEREANGSNQDE